MALAVFIRACRINIWLLPWRDERQIPVWLQLTHVHITFSNIIFLREKDKELTLIAGYIEQNKIMSVVHYDLSNNKIILVGLMFNMLDHFLYNGHHLLCHISFHLWETSTSYYWHNSLKKLCVTKIKHDLFNYHIIRNLIHLELIETQLC